MCVVPSGGEREEEGGGVEQTAHTHCEGAAERAAGNTHIHTHTLIPGVFQRLVNVSHVALQRQRHCELNQQAGSRKISVISPFGQIL